MTIGIAGLAPGVGYAERAVVESLRHSQRLHGPQDLIDLRRIERNHTEAEVSTRRRQTQDLLRDPSGLHRSPLALIATLASRSERKISPRRHTPRVAR